MLLHENDMYRLFCLLNKKIPPLMPLTEWRQNVRHTLTGLSGETGHCNKCNKLRGEPCTGQLAVTFDLVAVAPDEISICLYPPLGYNCEKDCNRVNRTRMDCASVEKLVAAIEAYLKGGKPSPPPATLSLVALKKERRQSEKLSPLLEQQIGNVPMKNWHLKLMPTGKIYYPQEIQQNLETMRADYVESIADAGRMGWCWCL